MKKAIIFHGTLGSAEGNWFRWLESELKKKGLEVWLPVLPNAQQPSLKEWKDFVLQNCPFSIDKETLVIGHSSGSILAVILAGIKKVGAIVCVSVFHDNSLKWEANNRLFDEDFDFEKVKQNTQTRIFIHSDDDPYVPLNKAKYVADGASGEFIVIPGQGHFNLEKSEDYKQFPRLYEELSKRSLL